jgi:hypothetical protein
MKRTKIIFILSLFLFGTASLLLQAQMPIASEQDFMAMQPNGDYILMNDITVNQMYLQTFTGRFSGNNHKITLRINENSPSVGLFREVLNGFIRDLIIDGEVIGGPNSEYVGSLAGRMTGICNFITNLADVTGRSANSSVGGIAGIVSGNGECVANTNNGTITGGQFVGGIIGKVETISSLGMKVCKNAGTIQSNGIVNPEKPNYVAGIIAFATYINNYPPNMIYDLVNIGKILGRNFNYAGGIIGYSENYQIYASSNAGIVDAALEYTGGIVGYLNDGVVRNCINTNWVSRTMYSGAIVGYNDNGTIDSCYYDEQMCILNGIGSGIGMTTGFPTTGMLGNSLQPLFSHNISRWEFQNNLYPRTRNIQNDHPIDLLSAAPIYLQNNERLDGVSTDFFVSNYGSTPPFPQSIPIYRPYNYQWASFSNGSIISIPMRPLNYAIINSRGEDTLYVRLFDPPLFYNTILEKVVPIWVR